MKETMAVSQSTQPATPPTLPTTLEKDTGAAIVPGTYENAHHTNTSVQPALAPAAEQVQQWFPDQPDQLNLAQPATAWLAPWTQSRWWLFHGITITLLALAWIIDKDVYLIMYRHYHDPSMKGELHQLILSLAMYGQALGICMTLLLMFLFDVRHRGRVAMLGIVLVGVGLTNSVAKALVGRERPLHSAGETILKGPQHGIRESRNQSFPSGHTATAVALSCTLAHYYPTTRPFAWILASGVAFNRLITVRHFLSDVIAGAWVGFVLASIILRIPTLRQLTEWLSHRTHPDVLAEKWHHSPWTWCRWFNPNQLNTALTSPLLLAVVSLTIHWSGNQAVPLWDRDEPRFATATREMMAQQEWIVPTFNAELRPDKPILIYWLMRGSYSLFGDNPFGARFVSGLSGTLACLLIWWFGRQLFRPAVGLMAAWMLALSPMLIVESKLATVDALLLVWISAEFAGLWFCYQSWRLAQPTTSTMEPTSDQVPEPTLNTWFGPLLFWSALSLGILTKGPVALAIPATAIFLFCLLRGEVRWLGRTRPLMGLSLVLLLVGPWCYLVQQQTEGAFLRQALGHHVLRRSFEPLENHRGFPGLYLVSLFGLMAPWAWFLPWTIGQIGWRWRRDPRLTFLLCWAIGPMLLFEAVRTKLVHYYLPAYPALLLLIAAALLTPMAGKTLGVRRLPRALGWIFLSVGLGALVLVPLVLSFLLPPAIAVWGSLVAVVSAAGTVVAGVLYCQHRFRWSFLTACAALAAGLLLATTQLLPRLGEQRVVLEMGDRLKVYKQTHPLAFWLYREPSLVYYSDTTLPVLDPLRGQPPLLDARAYAQKVGRYLCPMTPEQFRHALQDELLQLDIQEVVSRFDLNGMRLRHLYLVAVSLRPATAAHSSESLDAAIQ